jgi:ring-1,2-phenylacetyl-CoA epoxidase subunit PaaB
MKSRDWPLWEVFVRSENGLAHKHVGSLHAADATQAVQNARDLYTRRNEGVSIWVVKSSDIVATDPSQNDAFFEPSEDKAYRHATFYHVPEGVKHL